MNVERANVASESGYQVTEQKEKNEEENWKEELKRFA